MDNYPLGAKNDLSAPYNEPLTKEVKVEINVELGLFINVDVIDEDDIKEAVDKAVRDKFENKDTIVNNVTIWNYDILG